jgi:hypothetical protein
MSKGFINFIIYFFSPLIILGQPTATNADCSRVKNGNFYFYPVNTQKGFRVDRKGAVQSEINLETRDTSFWKVNWENDCAFDLKFIRKSQAISDDEKSFYSAHVTVFKILSVTKDYYVFKAGLDSITDKSVLTDTLWRESR